MINVSGLIYTFEAIITSFLAYKLWLSYQKSKNRIAKDFVCIGVLLVLTLFIIGLSCFAFSQNPRFLKFGQLIGRVFLLISSAFGLKVFFYTELKQIPSNLAFFITALFGFVIFFLDIKYPGYPWITRGIVEWNVEPLAFWLLGIVILAFTITLTITFIRSGLKESEVRTRSFGLALGFFLAGIGTVLNISNFGWPIIVLGGILTIFGFLSVAFVFFFVKVSGE